MPVACDGAIHLGFTMFETKGIILNGSNIRLLTFGGINKND